jgi:hypothetical protein
MSHKPSSVATGIPTTAVGAAAQAVVTTKYSVGTAVKNVYGDRYAKITVKSDKAFDLYVFGSRTSFASVDTGVSAGVLLDTYTGNAANGGATTGPDGKVFIVTIAGNTYVLPVVYQATGANAAVTITVKTFNG